MSHRETGMERQARTLREELKLARLASGGARVLVVNVAVKLEENVGRWHKIYYGRCRPGYLYQYNRGRELLDQRITMRGVAACMRGERQYYYAMLLPAGIKGEFVA